MTRRVIHHKAINFDNEVLQVITIYEEGVCKSKIKIDEPNAFTKRHDVLVKRGDKYEFKNE